MKKLLLIAMLALTGQFMFAQHCGPSGPFQCIPNIALAPGTFTPSENIPCILRGRAINQEIQFLNFDTFGIVLPGFPAYAVRDLRFDSIENLPAGLCWHTNNANDTIGEGERVCIRITGITNAPPGQYKLKIKIAFTHILSPLNEVDSVLNAGVYLRLVDSTFTLCPPVDYTQTADFEPLSDYYQNAAQISGKIFFDLNQNQILDNGEQGILNEIVTAGNGYIGLSGLGGNYSVYPPTGTYAIKPVLKGELASFAYSPDSIVVQANNAGVNHPNNYFAIVPSPNYCQGTLTIFGGPRPPRPGFSNSVNVQYANALSATAVSQTVQLSYPAPQLFLSSNPAPDNIDAVNRILTWNTSGINSGTIWQATATFSTPSTTSIGTIFNYNALISNSSCPRVDSLRAEEDIRVVGAYDPNDKAVSPVGDGPYGRVSPSTDQFSYTIRFQNTGTYMAENVILIDTISPHLNMNTLQVLAASHNYEVRISGREVWFLFNNIFLPDSNANEPLSHGFIKYSIEPTASFVEHTVIENFADIYFDFNEPIRTNTTRSTAHTYLGISETSSNSFVFEIFPNPLANGNWQLLTDRGAIGKELKIYDLQGREVYTLQLHNQQTEINGSQFQPGTYILRLGTKAVRIIKL